MVLAYFRKHGVFLQSNGLTVLWDVIKSPCRVSAVRERSFVQPPSKFSLESFVNQDEADYCLLFSGVGIKDEGRRNPPNARLSNRSEEVDGLVSQPERKPWINSCQPQFYRRSLSRTAQSFLGSQLVVRLLTYCLDGWPFSFLRGSSFI